MLTLRGLTLTAAAPRIIVPLFARSLDALRPLAAAAQADPAGPEKGVARVCRGGGWNDFAKHLRSAYRSSQMPGDAFRSRGFRLARNK